MAQLDYEDGGKVLRKPIARLPISELRQVNDLRMKLSQVNEFVVNEDISYKRLILIATDGDTEEGKLTIFFFERNCVVNIVLDPSSTSRVPMEELDLLRDFHGWEITKNQSRISVFKVFTLPTTLNIVSTAIVAVLSILKLRVKFEHQKVL